MKIFLILFFITISLPLFALEKVSLQLAWKYQFEFAGFVAAKEKGFYKDAGLDVELREYNENIDIVNDVLNGKSTYGIQHTSISIEDNKIKPIVILATFLQKAPLVFIAQKGINHISKIKNKTIMGTKSELKYSALGLMLKHYDINENNSNIVTQSYNLDDFKNKKIDVMSAFRSNQLYELKKEGIPFEIIEPFDYGFNMSAGNLFTSSKEALTYPKRTQKFIDATNKGWKYAIENSDELIDILIEKYGVKKTKEALEFEALEIEKLMMLDFFKIGEINDELTKLSFRQLKKAKLLDEEEVLNSFVFHDLIKNINKEFSLSIDEELYLKNKQFITMCVDPLWYPFEAIENNKHIGIAADVMKDFEKKINIPITYINVKNWQESIDLAKNRSCDIFSIASKTILRSEYMNFTTPYLNLPIVIATTNEKLYIDDIKKLKGKKIAAVQGYSIIETLRTKHPYIEIVEVKSINEGLDLVLQNKVYGYIDSLMVISSSIQKEYTGMLKVSARLNESLSFSVGTRNDEPILYDIFEKLVLSLNEQDMQVIYNSWASTIEEVSSINKENIMKITGLFILLLAIFLNRQYVLNKHNKELLRLSTTDKLTGLYNRLKTDEELEKEQKKVVRYENYTCSILLIDIDFFKAVNDKYGHLMGDKILKEIASIIKNNIRDLDIAARWGGEEFLVILPNTNKNEACNVANKLKEIVSKHTFYDLKQITVSIGGIELQKDFKINQSLQKADEALYKSKEEGRNRVTMA